MKTLAILLFLLGPTLAIPVLSPLTLVSESGFNQLTVKVDPQIDIGLPIDLSSSSATTLTGSVTAGLAVDPATGQTTELTLTEGRVTGTKLTFKKDVFLLGNVYNIVIDGLSAAVFTPAPPGVVDPGSGNFEADQHQFEIDQGAITGNASIPGQPVLEIDESFSPESPVTGNGSGVGRITLSPTGESDLHRDFAVTLTFPVNLDDTFMAGTNGVHITAIGIIKAVGTARVPRSEYLAWTIDQGIPGAAPDADANRDGVPNAIAWALGLDAVRDAGPFTPQVSSEGAFTLVLPPGGSAAPLHLEGSDTLQGWTDLPGLSPIPTGSAGPLIIAPEPAPPRFLRLRAQE